MNLNDFKILNNAEQGDLIKQWLDLNDYIVPGEYLVSDSSYIDLLRTRMFSLGYTNISTFQPKRYTTVDNRSNSLWSQGEFNVVFYKGSALEAQLKILSEEIACIISNTELEATVLAICDAFTRYDNEKTDCK